MEKLIAFLHSIYPLSQGLCDFLIQAVIVREAKRNEFLLEAGQVCRYLYFIERGALKCFYLKDGMEVYTWFMKEGDIVTSVPSFFRQSAGTEYIKVSRDFSAYTLSYDDYQYALRTWLEFNYIARVLTEQYYLESNERLNALRRTTPWEKFSYLVLRHLRLLHGEVPQRELASYMDLSLRTFNRAWNKAKGKRRQMA
jgi:CRP/FNR family transcriptional regulator, anaerobic regulatory protein